MDKQAIDELLQNWYFRAKRSQLAHRFAAKELSRLHLLMGALAVVLSTIAGTSIFASLEKELSGYGRIVVGILSLVVALLSGLQTFLRLDDLSSKHQRADASFSAIRGQIEQYRAIRRGQLDEIEETETFVDSIRQKMEDLSNDSPLVPEKYWQKARAIINAQGASKRNMNLSPVYGQQREV